MRRIIGLYVAVFAVLMVSCAKKKVTEKVDGLWYVGTLENKYYYVDHVGTCEFISGGTGAFNLSFFNPLAQQQVINKETFTWKNTKNTITITFDSNGERLYFKIEHLSKQMLRINSGDYTYKILTMNR